MDTLTYIIERLESRRMSLDRLRGIWCPCCLRVATIDPEVKRSFDLIWPGDDDCRNPLRDGTISECIADLRAEQANAGSVI